MDKKAVSERFAALAVTEQRPLIARFRDVFDAVQNAIDAGVSRIKARDELARLGLDLTQNTFNTFLTRIRKERDEKAKASSSNEKPAAAKLASNAQPEESAQEIETPTPVLQKTAVTKNARDLILPDDWLTAELTPAQSRSLSSEQKQLRRKARDRLFHPTPYDKFNT